MLVAATVALHGLDGLLIATFLCGVILVAVGFLRLGAFIRYIPYPVTVAFTAGIAVIIFASQVKDLLGLRFAGTEPGPFLPKLAALAEALPTISPAALLVAGLSIGTILVLRHWKPHWPAYLIAVALAALVALILPFPIETIGTRFGGIPHALPAPHLPAFSVARVVEMLPAALSFALLGGIESLLSAVVADSMTGRRHRSNSELVAQGFANIASSLFGGICVTGTIARTATNVRAGARGPVSGMLHAVFLLLFMVVAAPLASYIPLAALAAVLAIVAWNMAERHAFATLLRASRGDAVVLLVTFGLVVFRDLTEGILAGFGLSVLLFLHRMAQSVEIEGLRPMAQDDQPDTANGAERPHYDATLATDPDIMVYRISGAFFFGAAAGVAAALDRIGEHPKAFVIDFSAVPLLDSTAAATMEGFVRKNRRRGAAIYFAGARPSICAVLGAHGAAPPDVHFVPDIAAAMLDARRGLIDGTLPDQASVTPA